MSGLRVRAFAMDPGRATVRGGLGVLLVTIRVVLAELVAILVLVSVQAQLSVDHW